MTTTTDMQGQAAANVMEARETIPCPRCGGKGRYLCSNGFVERCNTCTGFGQVTVPVRRDHAPIVQREVG